MIFDFFHNTAEAMRTINRRYSSPHIKMTLMVRLSLLLLRFYLLFLVGILVYKFVITLHK
jgi:hypothetical protein